MSRYPGDVDGKPHPREDPEAVIREELGEHREVLEVLADMDLDELSEDARKALEILDETEPEGTTDEDQSVRGSFCPSCGEHVGTDDQFCRHCGRGLPGDHVAE